VTKTRFSAEQEQRFVEPNVFVTGRDQKSPSRRQSKIWKHLRSPFTDMCDVKRLEEVVIRVQFLAGPDVPPCGVALGRMSKTVERPQTPPDVTGDAHFAVFGGRKGFDSESPAYIELLLAKVSVRSHGRKVAFRQ
jgi:hypothetical protein